MAETTIESLHINFRTLKTSVYISQKIPEIREIANRFCDGLFKPLLVCDSNTRQLAETIRGDAEIPICEMKDGESGKNWEAVETILRHAHDNELGRDGVFIGVGGGVTGDLCAFAASIYKRGCSLVLIPTTLLAMVDAGLGGKTGIDLFGIKNLAGTFYPACNVYIALESLESLPLPEWKSGMAELIKTAILDDNDFLNKLASIAASFPAGSFVSGFPEDFAHRLLSPDSGTLASCISRAVQYKGGIVEEDPQDTGVRRILNLGHTFGHALESAVGSISHGEAVAWGIARSCDLALALDMCPRERVMQIRDLLSAYGYETSAPHPLLDNTGAFMQALYSDKKRNKDLVFIVPDAKSAVPVFASPDTIHTVIFGEILF
jgi:3-dehydroquinate synthase